MPSVTSSPQNSFKQYQQAKITFSGRQPAPHEMEPGADFADEDLEDANFSGKHNLQNASFAKSNLTDANLANSNLQNAGFQYAKLIRTQLYNLKAQGANFNEVNSYATAANFSDADLDDSSFSNALLQNADFRGTHLNRAIMNCSDLTGANLSNIKAKQADFRVSNLTNASFDNANLDQANFDNANLANAQFQGASLQEANFQNAILANTKLFNVKAPKADFSWVKDGHKVFLHSSILNNSRFYSAYLPEAVLASSHLSGANMQGVNLNEANLSHIQADRSDFKGAKLRGAKLSASDLTNSNFIGADLKNAALTTSDLSRAILARAILSHADFKNTNLNEANISSTALDWTNFSNSMAKNANFCKTRGFSPDFSNCDLSGANFIEAKYTDPNFLGSRLNQAKFNNAELSSAELNGIKAPEADFSNTELSQSGINQADLRGANFQKGTLRGCGFKGADLSRANFVSSIINDSSFSQTRLIDSNFSNATINNANLSSTLLTHSKWTKANLDRVKFNNILAEGADFSDSKGIGLEFADANLNHSRFIDTNYTEGSFLGAQINQASFNNAKLINSQFHNVKGIQADFRRADLNGANFSQALLKEANFEGAFLSNAKLESSNLESANLARSLLESANLRYTNLNQANLTKANLSEADLTGASLEKANLAEANLQKTNLSNTDLSAAKNIKLADFEGSFYRDGLKPKLPDHISPEQLGIHKVKSDNSNIDDYSSNGTFFSFYNPKQFAKLSKTAQNRGEQGAKAEYTFFKYIAEGKDSQDWMREFIHHGDRIDQALELVRKGHQGEEVSDFYTPESREAMESNEGAIPLQLDNFRLNTESGLPYSDLNSFKDACLAQQLYSNYLKHSQETEEQPSHSSWFSRSPLPKGEKTTFWLERLKKAFEDDYELETSSTTTQTAPFLNWLTKKYHLYQEPKFDFNRSLEQVFSHPEEEEEAGLSNVMGYAQTKNKLKEKVLAPLTFPMISRAGAAKPHRGWIFYGEPGTGKSHLAKAVSNQIGLKPVEVSLSSIGSSYENQTVRNLTTQFEKAKRLAQRHGASVVLLDEMNQVGDHRQKGGNNKSDLTNALLNMITKYVEQAKENIICIGTTNDINSVDPAIKRAGRLGAHQEIETPDEESRKAFLNQQLPQGDHFLRPLELYEGGRNEIINYIASKTEGKPTATLKALVDRLSGGYNDKVTRQDVDSTLNQIKKDLKKQI